MTSYYISTDGADTDAGNTSDVPWATFTNIDTDIAAGDIIHFKTGHTWNDTLTLPVSGTSDSPITITWYDTNISAVRPKFLGAENVTGFVVATDNVYVKSGYDPNLGIDQCFQDSDRLDLATDAAAMAADHFFVSSNTSELFIWTANSDDPDNYYIEFSNKQYGIKANGQSWWDINNLHFTKYSHDGVVFTDVVTPSDMNFSNCLSNWNGHRGFDMGTYDTDAAIDRIIFYSCTADNNVNEGFWLGCGTGSGCDSCHSWANTKDRVSQGHTGGTGGSQFNMGLGSINTFVRGSTSSDCYCAVGTGPQSAEYEASYPRPTGCIWERNTFESSTDANKGNLWDMGTNTVIRNNILMGAGSDNAVLLQLRPGSSGVTVYHNTFYQDGDTNVSNITCIGAGAVTIKNNIFFCTDGYAIYVDSDALDTDFVSNHNMWYGSQNCYHGSDGWITFAAWQALGDDVDSSGTDVDPLFVDVASRDFTLQFTSPAIDAATDVGVTEDRNNDTRPIGIAPDIGAYEMGKAKKATFKA